MEKLDKIHGVICPLVTPFDESDCVDYEGIRNIVEYLISNGIDGLMVNGSTGEGPLLSLAERKAICEVVVKQNDGRLPIIVQTGSINTRDSVALTEHAFQNGATAVAIIVPYFFGLDDESLFTHYLAIAKSVPNYPVFVYTYPDNAKNDISPALLRRLINSAPNIIGIKSSNPDLVRFQEYMEIGGCDFLAFNGVDSLMLPALSLGADGQISGNANVFPKIFCSLYKAFTDGDYDAALAGQRLINNIRGVLMDGHYPAYFKAGLSIRGVPGGCVRSPMRELNLDEMKILEKSIREIDEMAKLLPYMSNSAKVEVEVEK